MYYSPFMRGACPGAATALGREPPPAAAYMNVAVGWKAVFRQSVLTNVSISLGPVIN